MKYGQLKKLLTERGFKLEYIQTDGQLDMMDYSHPNVEGEVHVSFDDDYELPQDIIDGREFSYDEEWLEDVPINSIDFDIDVSIAFLSDDVIDTIGSENMNRISLFGKDVELAEQVLDIIIDPFSFINFQETYANKQIEFFNLVKKFLPVIKKYNFVPFPQKRSGDESTLFTSLSLCFSYKGNSSCYVDFFMRVLNWEKSIFIMVEPGYMTDSSEQSLDVSVEDFEKELIRQMETYDRVYGKRGHTDDF